MFSLVLALLAFEADRPPRLPDRAGCEHYRGIAHGNDPSVQLDVVLCPDAGGVGGDVQWSSLLSGWNQRRVSGRWDGDVLHLRDLEVVQEKPEPGWRFCEIETYELTRTAEGLSGTYRSPACDDTADLTLTRVDAPAAGARSVVPGAKGNTAPKAPPPTHPAADDRPSRADAAAGGCGCEIGPHPGKIGWLGWGTLLVATAVRRRPRS